MHFFVFRAQKSNFAGKVVKALLVSLSFRFLEITGFAWLSAHVAWPYLLLSLSFWGFLFS